MGIPSLCARLANSPFLFLTPISQKLSLTPRITTAFLPMQLRVFVDTLESVRLIPHRICEQTALPGTPEFMSRAHDSKSWLRGIIDIVFSAAQGVAEQCKLYAYSVENIHDCCSILEGAIAWEQFWTSLKSKSAWELAEHTCRYAQKPRRERAEKPT